MTVRSLFNIIIKVIGIFLIKDIIFSIPYLIRTIYDSNFLIRKVLFLKTLLSQ
jgi:hypothetical protein